MPDHGEGYRTISSKVTPLMNPTSIVKDCSTKLLLDVRQKMDEVGGGRSIFGVAW